MKKIVGALLLMLGGLVFGSMGFAAEKATLGKNNFSVKVSSIHFDDGDTDNGISVSAEGYKEIEKNLYLGVEAGYTNVDGKVNLSGTRVDSDIVFLPIELNLKYAIRITNHLIVDFGIGGSYSYVKEEISRADEWWESVDLDEWLFGGQCFADVHVTIGKMIIGVNGKVQVTDKSRDAGKNYSNRRIGGHIGIMF